MRGIMDLLNADAKLLKGCLAHHTSWLQRQRAAAAAAGQAQAEGPPAGAFSHKEAVDAWHNLLLEVIHNGNYYLLQARSAACVLCTRPRPKLRLCVSLCITLQLWRHAAGNAHPGPPADPASCCTCCDCWSMAFASHLSTLCRQPVLFCHLQEQLEQMVAWATKDAVTAYDSGANQWRPRSVCASHAAWSLGRLSSCIADLLHSPGCVSTLGWFSYQYAAADAGKNWRLAMLMVLSARKEVLPQVAGGWRWCSPAAAAPAATASVPAATAALLLLLRRAASAMDVAPRPFLPMPPCPPCSCLF